MTISKKKKSVCVIGGAGCIGSAVVNYLNKKNYHVKLFDLREQIDIKEKSFPKDVEIIEGSVLDKSSLQRLIKTGDIVIHLAASLGVKNTEENLYRCYQINVKGTENVLDICLQRKIKKFIFSSSSEVYGEPLKNPIKESFPVYGKSFYAVTKLMGEHLIKSYSQMDPNLKYVILRFFNTYGKYQVAQFAIPKFIYRAKNKLPIQINGDGNQTRSYCHANDTAIAVEKSLNNKRAENKIFNIGNSKELVKVKDLARLIVKKVGNKNKITLNKNFKQADRSVSREIYNRFCDGSQAKKILKFTAKITLSEGLDELIYYKIRKNWPNL